MFKNLTNLNYARSGKEAIGFYLAYLLVVIILSGLVSAIVGSFINPHNAFYTGTRVGTLTAIISCIALSYMVIEQKKLTGKFSSILLTLFSGVLAMFGGGVLGLIIPAYLSTKKTTSGKKAAPKKKGKKK